MGHTGGFAERFVTTCARHAENRAVDDGRDVVGYAELLAVARSIGATVAERVPEGGVAAVVATKSVWGLAATFGVVLAGRSALLLDPDDPTAWWDERCARVGAHVLLADDAVGAEATSRLGVARVAPGDCPPGRIMTATSSVVADPWIMCTSGSTGVPKVVWNDDRAMSESWDRLHDRAASDGFVRGRVPVLPPLAFAAARVPLFQSLSVGACAVLVDAARSTPGQVVDLIDGGTHLYTDPAMLRALVGVLDGRGSTLASIEQVEVAGAAVHVDDVGRVRRAFPRAWLSIRYGSTELATVTSLDLAPDADVTTPGALAGTVSPGRRVRVVDDEDVEVVIGTVGDLLVGTQAPVGRYRDDPDLARQSQLVDADGTVWHRTGDRARVLTDGRVELVGRDDDRVKVNGVPVDLNVVAASVGALDGVLDVAVSAVDTDGDGDARLVAWIVMEEGRRPTVRDLRRDLALSLPRSMQPHIFRAVGAIPYTTRGKIDRMALRASAARELPLGVAHVVPRSPREADLASRFQVALDIDTVGVHETFFELGGDSLDALELVSALVDELNLAPEHQTELEQVLVTDGSIAALAAVLDDPAGASRRAELRSDGVVRLVLRDDGKPGDATVVVIPGGGQTPVALRPLVARLEGCRVWTLLPPGFRAGSVTDRSIAEVADRFADALLAADPDGEFVVAGFSFGGLVAFEVARALVGRNARVRLVALLDVEAPSPRIPLGRALRWAHARAWVRARFGRRARRARRARRGVGSATHDARRDSVDVLHGESMQWARALIDSYDPSPLGVDALVVSSARAVRDGRPEDRGWARCCTGSLHTFDVTGGHLDVLREPAVAMIGPALVAAAVT